LADDSLESLGAGTVQQGCGLAREGLARPDRAAHPAQDLEQSLATFDQGRLANRPGSNGQQVKHDVIDSSRHRAIEALLQLLEVTGCATSGDYFAIEDQVVSNLLAASCDRRKPMGPIQSVARVQGALAAMDNGLDSVAVVLDLVQPLGTRGDGV